MDTCKGNENIKKRKSFKKKNPIGYALGSGALFAVACAAIPVIMIKATGMLYKATTNTAKDDDEWGPIIERKTPAPDTAEGQDKEE